MLKNSFKADETLLKINSGKKYQELPPEIEYELNYIRKNDENFRLTNCWNYEKEVDAK